jgi:hypothetical protein
MEYRKGTRIASLLLGLCCALPCAAQELAPPGAPAEAVPAAAGAVTFMTQTVFLTQFVKSVRASRVPAVPAYKPWLYPGLGHIALGETGRGVGQAVIFSSTVAASAGFLIAGLVNFGICEDRYNEALAEIDYSARSNLLVQRDRYYNRYNILSSYAEASLAAAAVVYVYSVLDYYYSRGRLSRISLDSTPSGAQLAYRRRF